MSKFLNLCFNTDALSASRKNSASTMSSGPSFSQSTPRGSMIGAPPFEKVLAGEAKIGNPWTPEVFLDFLESELNEENLVFFEKVEALKSLQGINDAKIPKDAMLLLPMDGGAQDDVTELSKQIIEEFIKENSPLQINISHDQRTKLLKLVDESLRDTNRIDASVFLEAQNEVKKLMLQDSWPRFVRKSMSENVAEWDRKQRLMKGIVLCILVLLGIGLCLGYLVPRWYLFLFMYPIFEMVDSFVTYKTRLCVMNAVNGKFDGYTKAIRVSASCPMVKHTTTILARKQFRLEIAIVVILTLFFFTMTYMIEAGQGRSMYG